MRRFVFYGIAGALSVLTGTYLLILLPGTWWSTVGVVLVWVGFYFKGHSSYLRGKGDNSIFWEED